MQPLTHQYTYAFSHLAVRDQVVFKSIVGLLSGRTHAQWLHIETGLPDLLVLGPESEAGAVANCTAKVVLTIAQNASAEDALSIHWPLRASEVFERLELADRLVSDERACPSQNAAPQRYKLMGWPSQELLGRDANHLRLATLLGARALTLDELSERTGIAPQICDFFIQRLLDAKLLRTEAVEAVVKQDVTPTAPGFFARLRAHLGLSGTRVTG